MSAAEGERDVVILLLRKGAGGFNVLYMHVYIIYLHISKIRDVVVTALEEGRVQVLSVKVQERIIYVFFFLIM